MIDTDNACGRFYRAVPGLTIVLFIVGTVGCKSHPIPTQVRQIQMEMLTSNVPSPGPNSYSIYQMKDTVGRFPCGLSVMRITGSLPDDPDQPAEDAGKRLLLDLLPEIKAVPWTELFDNLPAITTVKVMGRPALVFEQVTLDELIEAGRRQHTELLLIYGQHDLDDGLVRIVGAIYETATGKLLATVEAKVTPVLGLPAPSDRVEQDRRHEDPECLTAKEFQKLVLYCIFELSQLDTPSTTTQPNPWDRPEVRPMLSPWTGEGVLRLR